MDRFDITRTKQVHKLISKVSGDLNQIYNTETTAIFTHIQPKT